MAADEEIRIEHVMEMTENTNQDKEVPTSILLVDDFPGVRRFLRDILKSQGHRFLEAGNGEDAVRIYQESRPDWVVMDVEMPVLDGLKAAGVIRENDPAARIIIMSQYDDRAFHLAALEAGAFLFLHKDNLLSLPDCLANATSPHGGSGS